MGKNQPVCFFSKGVKLLFCFKNMSHNSCFVCQGLKRIEEREELICVVIVCFKSCTILMFKIWMRELCCVKFCMVSCHLWMAIMPQEHPGESTESYKKGIWGCALVFTRLHTFKKWYVARTCIQKQCTTGVIWRSVKRNTCIVYQVSRRASLIPSSVSSLDFFHCSMKYIQIHTLFYAINCLKCKMVILCTAEVCGTVSPHCLSCPRQLC